MIEFTSAGKALACHPVKSVAKTVIRKALAQFGYELQRIPSRWHGDQDIPDAAFYHPFFSPWLGYGEFKDLHREVAPYTLVSPEKCWHLSSLAAQALSLPGDFMECGVYKGGTAMLLSRVLARAPAPGTRKLLLFDSFSGMRQTTPGQDLHQIGHFADTSVEDVQKRVGWFKGAEFYPGWIPETFRGLEHRQFAFAHVDVDLHQSVLDCCQFIYPRLNGGGIMVFDDYGVPSCPGARRAVDSFFNKKPEVPLILSTGQALVFKLPAEGKTL
jgi:O-methyltransferase